MTVIERSPGFQSNLAVSDRPLAELAETNKLHLLSKLEPCFQVDAGFRGLLKQALVAVGYPAEDLAGCSG